MQTAIDVLLVLFLALGCTWLAIDLVRKIRQRPVPRDLGPSHTPTTKLRSEVPAASLKPEASPIPVASAIPAATLRTAAPTTPELPAAHLAAITAAVHHLFRGRGRLVAAFAAPSPGGTHPPIDWAREGRRDIFSSHRVR
jgi:hypothetical protein